MPAPLTWGVTVDEVSALAPHITIKADPATPLSGDAVFGANQPRAITVDQVNAFISDVASRVQVRMLRIGSVTDDNIRVMFEKAAHDLTVNGAASYLVAAAFPAKAGLSDQSSLSAEYWRRFSEGLDALSVALIDWLTPNEELPGGEAAAAAGLIMGSFPAVAFPDPPEGPYPVECPPGMWMYPWP